ncbi:hypothetical protein D030_2575B, partial [Vibrio parahaemolyticus AQ3810]
KRRISAAFFIK